VHRAAIQTLSIILLALLASVFVGCNRPAASGTEASGDPSAVAATVNGKNIMLSEVEKLISSQTQGQQSQLSPLQLAQARLQVLDGLIKNEVLFQRAEKEKLLPTEDEITQQINDQKQKSGMTDDAFQKQLKDQNMTEASLREEMRKQLAIQKLQDKYNAKISVSDREVEDFYNNNKQQFVNARGVELANIAIDPADNGMQDDAKSDPEAKAKIDNIYQQLKSGADFATVARSRSEDPNSNARGGDIGFATEDDLKQNGFPQDLIAQFFGPMQVGSFTPPVHFSNGRWYIFKLAEKRLQNENLTLDSPGVRPQIAQALTNQRKEILNAALLIDAMSESKVVNNLARNMLNSPSNLGSMRPAAPANAASPAASTSPATSASPAASSASPASSSGSTAINPSASPASGGSSNNTAAH
jgi:parvulin-like peptidyl-prolyl isomerase